MKCVVCKENDAVQEHHISYEPEMKIDVCIFCHLRIHIFHGVGKPRGYLKGNAHLNPTVERTLIEPRYTKWDDVSDRRTLLSKDGEPLLILNCPNGCDATVWRLLGKATSHETFLSCMTCGYDVKIEGKLT